MTEPDEQLRDALRDLIPGYRGPTDPLPRVVASVRRRRLRQRTLLTVGGAALAALAVLAGPVVLAPTTGDGTTQAASAPGGAGPRPPSPTPREVASGTVDGVAWSTGAVSIGPGALRCLTSDDELAVAEEVLCFDDWKGDGANWSAVVSTAAGLRATRVVGVTTPDTARLQVRFTEGPPAAAVAVRALADPSVRFFALVVRGDRTVRDVTLLDLAGAPIGRPVTDPGPDACTPGPNAACAAPK